MSDDRRFPHARSRIVRLGALLGRAQQKGRGLSDRRRHARAVMLGAVEVDQAGLDALPFGMSGHTILPI